MLVFVGRCLPSWTTILQAPPMNHGLESNCSKEPKLPWARFLRQLGSSSSPPWMLVSLVGAAEVVGLTMPQAFCNVFAMQSWEYGQPGSSPRLLRGIRSPSWASFLRAFCSVTSCDLHPHASKTCRCLAYCWALEPDQGRRKLRSGVSSSLHEMRCHMQVLHVAFVYQRALGLEGECANPWQEGLILILPLFINLQLCIVDWINSVLDAILNNPQIFEAGKSEWLLRQCQPGPLLYTCTSCVGA